jgi:hypothetical protein
MESRSHVIARESGRPSNPGNAAEYWIPAFAGMTPENGQAVYQFHFA